MNKEGRASVAGSAVEGVHFRVWSVKGDVWIPGVIRGRDRLEVMLLSEGVRVAVEGMESALAETIRRHGRA